MSYSTTTLFSSISIHALREEGDISPALAVRISWHFYPRPPRGGRLFNVVLVLHDGCNFYPRPPRGGRQLHRRSSGRYYGISIHALREEGDHPGALFLHGRAGFLSTPSARRATTTTSPARCQVRNFYPRPPRGGRRIRHDHTYQQGLISIHALREEGDSDLHR